MIERDLTLPDGAVLHTYDAGGAGLPVLWHHGTPNTGLPPTPLVADAERLGLRWVGYDRPGYGGSTPSRDRSVGSAATYAAAVADALGLESFAVMGHSGGGPHALATAALLPDRVVAAVSVSGLAPYGPEGLEHDAYVSGMCASGRAGVEATAQGRAAKEAHEAAHGEEYDPEFTAADLEMFGGPWRWFIEVVQAAAPSGPAPAIDDDLAYVRPWGADPAEVVAPTLLVHGEQDRVVPADHARRLAELVSDAELWLLPDAGHISAMSAGADAVAWLAGRAR